MTDDRGFSPIPRLGASREIGCIGSGVGNLVGRMMVQVSVWLLVLQRQACPRHSGENMPC